MTKTKKTGHTCVGDLRLAPLDVGFCLKATRTPVVIPEWHFASVGLEDRDGQVYLIEGTREELVAAIKKAGYRVKNSPRELCSEAQGVTP